MKEQSSSSRPVRLQDLFIRRLGTLLLIGLLTGLGLRPIPAQTQIQSQPRRVALIVGNSAYQKLGKLKNPGNDARDVGQSLKDLGFDVEVLVDAGLGEMNEAVDRFGRRLAGAEAGLFFYAGHGVQSGGTNFLVPVDADVQAEYQLKYRAVAADFILDTMNASGCGLNIVVLDACRDNPFSSFRSGSRGLAMLASAPAGAIIVYATDPGKTASDGLGDHGTFTEAFLKHVSTPGLDVKEFFDKVGSDVATVTRQQQTPWVSSKYYGSYYLAGSSQSPLVDSKATQIQPSVPKQAAAASSQGKAELIVRTNVEGAEILAGGSPLGLAGDVLSIPAGAEIEIIAKKGYLLGKSTLKPQSGQLYELDLELKQQKGNLLIKAKDAEAAKVYLDGTELGLFGKGLFRDLPAGEHEYRIAGSSFAGSGTILIAPEITTTLSPIFVDVGMLRTVMPEECRVVVQAQGFGPAAIGPALPASKQSLEGIPVGAVKVIATGPGYEPAEAELTIRKGLETVWTPWTTGSLRIGSQPASAEISVNGKPIGRAPQTARNLAPGKAVITARAEGYEEATINATVILGKTMPATISLARSLGGIRPLVKDDVSIIVENEESGRRESSGSKPLRNLPTGNYRVFASGPGYEPVSATVQVRRNEETAWQPWPTGSVRVESNPSGALAIVGGKEVGKTPLVCEGLTSGALVPIEVRAEGYERAEAVQEITGGKTLDLRLDLTRSMGTLNLDIPADAEARVESEEIGERMAFGFQVLSLPTGIYTVSAGGKGFETMRSTVFVLRNQETRWRPWTTGSLRVESEPAGAEIWVDGKNMGVGPIALTGLSPSTISVAARLRDYEDATIMAAILAGKTTSILVPLSKSQGKLTIEAPAGSLIRYTGASSGQILVGPSGTAMASLPVGPYSLFAQKSDYDPDETRITVSKAVESAWTPWTTGSLRVESDPPGAEVSMGGLVLGATPLVIPSLPPVKTSIVLRAPGYEDGTIQATPIRGRTTPIPIRLARSQGTLRVIATDDASILVSNAEIGERRASGAETSFSLPTGEYRVEARRIGAAPEISTIRIESGASQAWMPWDKGFLRVSSDPPGARVLIDGIERGITPLSIDMEARKKSILTVSLARYDSFNTEFTLGIGQTREITARLQQTPGSVFIQTDPPGVTVILDDNNTNWKITPCTFESVSTGDHVITFNSLSIGDKIYRSAKANIRVQVGERVQIEKRMERLTALLAVQDAMPGSKLYIDGSFITDSRVFSEGIEIPSGEYSAELVGPQGQVWRQNVRLFWNGASLNWNNMEYIVLRFNIKIDGNLADWVRIPQVFFPSTPEDPAPKIAGTKISAGYVCRDEKNLYLRVDFSDGLPDPKGKTSIFEFMMDAGSKRLICSIQNSLFGRVVNIQNIMDASDYYRAGSFAETSTGYEISLPLETLSKFSKINPVSVFAVLRTTNGSASGDDRWIDETNGQYLGKLF